MTSLLTIPTPNPSPQWQPATWADYERSRDSMVEGAGRVFFNQGYLWVDMGGEGINHARFNDLITLVFFIWFSQKAPEQVFDSMSGCLFEKLGHQAASPDKVLYLGSDAPRWREKEPRSIDLDKWRVPDLVAEVADTTLASDLDEKKQLYAALGMPEYWVVDVKGQRVLAFRLDELGRYQEIAVSIALAGLPIDLITQTLAQLAQGKSNSTAAQWFGKQINSAV
jgi:Uma2 family endonuclease